MKLGSLFSGYGGLELGIGQALPVETAWHVEFDAAPSRILEHHWPGIPNLGDVTTVDWAAVEPVDVLTGGFPCQDVSTAGLRRGLKPGTRSGLWSHFALAIDALRPSLVIIENVRGLLSAEAHSDLESDPWDLGGSARGDRPPLRALGAVLGDLAELGFDAEWQGVRAADAGAPHGRFRVFIIARPARDADGGDRGRGAARRDARPPGPSTRFSAPDAEHVGGHGTGGARDRGTEPADRPRAAADADRLGAAGGGRPVPRPAGTAEEAPDERERDGDAAVDHRAASPDPDDARPRREADDACRREPDAAGSGRRSERAGRGTASPAPDPDGRGLGSLRRLEPLERDPDRRDRPHVAWGDYEPAIRRWEAVTGRPAPAPTETSRRGDQRLAPAFVEWMMGLPAGHVTDPAIGLTRSEQLKALGNGVVPQQAALAVRSILEGRA